MEKMNFERLEKYVFCTNITTGARIISLIGIIISIFLITVLLNDKYLNKEENYEMSRKTALALGLDWQHFDSKASTALHIDPEGKNISIIVIFYSAAFLFLNLLLCFATIKRYWIYAVPWLVCELFGCLSKFGALMYHLYYDQNNLSHIFITGSVIYMVVMLWWWMVVFLALLSWKRKGEDTDENVELSNATFCIKSSQDIGAEMSKIRYAADSFQDSGNMDSPKPYAPNQFYSLI